jgi:alpha-L-rhamnosidase
MRAEPWPEAIFCGGTSRTESWRGDELSNDIGNEGAMTNAANRPWDLRVEHLDDAFGIDVTVPRLSWKLPETATRQSAYRLRVGAWDSGRVEADASVLVAYGGPPLTSRQQVEAAVLVWTDLGVSEWSTPVRVEMGLLAVEDWTARWIQAVDTGSEPGRRGAAVLRKTFTVANGCDRARLYATADGVYELFLNGERVGDQELTPGFTSYRSRLQVQSYDVTGLLRTGTNELRAVLSDGWFRGFVGFTREHDVFGARLALLAQLELDGVPVAASDESWETAPGAIVAADLVEGQHTDERVTDDDVTWTAVKVVEGDFARLCGPLAPPVRRVELVEPARINEIGPDRLVVDLGQNINGWLRLNVDAPAGTTVTITHGEAVDSTGDVTMEHLAPIHWETQEPMSPGQVDRVTVGDAPVEFEPRHATHGFRYARVEGLTAPLRFDAVAGVVVHTDLRRTGWFTCSDASLNRLHDAAEWSFRTNACDVPTDCPQRERAGWTGDWQIFVSTAAFLYDVAGFSTKWLRDLAADQREDGCVRNFAPDPAYAGPQHPIKTFIEGSAGWGDAAVLVPWSIYRSYGDVGLLAEQWSSMEAWLGFQERVARNARHASRIGRSPEPAPHEQYLWDTGFHWGEWTEPGHHDDHWENLDRDFGIIATAYFEHSARTMLKIATVLGRDEDAARYGVLADRVRDAWRTEFLTVDGEVRSDRQADHVRALAFDLAPEDLKDPVADRLVTMVRENGTHLDTGFLATPMLLPVLADAGHAGLAYELLFQRTEPSWLTMIDRGATTIWEDWDGVDERGTPKASLNHYSKGAVVSFLHEYVAGIRLLDDGPAYRRFRIEPVPGGGLTAASAAHESPYGRIESSWTIVDDTFRLVVRVPPGSEAEVVTPDGTTRRVAPGSALFTVPYRAGKR